jgi:putative ABC transport system permease protein
MFRNYVVTALRNLARNRLYAAITILGLAVAFTAVILIGQFVRGEFSYDHWIPGYQRVYKITSVIVQPGQAPVEADIGPTMVASQIRAVFPGAEVIARLEQASPPTKARPGDEAVADTTFAWTDPDIFKVLPLPALAGDLDTALQQPDTVVITRSAARKYFHRDLPMGETLLVKKAGPAPGAGPSGMEYSWRAMRVTGVLKDLPSNTNLVTEVFASSRSAYSSLAMRDASPPNYGAGDAYTFVRLKRGVSPADLQRALDVATRPQSRLAAAYSAGATWLFHPVPLGEAHLTPSGKTPVITKPAGSRTIAYGIAGVGALIVLVAAINFVTLMTARAARRGVEVGVRKAGGATRTDLVVQFMGEALIQAAGAALIAAALAEMLIKPFSAFIQRDLALDFAHDPALLAAVVGGALVVGLLAGIYPALVLSRFRPAVVLKGGAVAVARGSRVSRTTLVVVQFAVLVCLIVTTVTVYRQTQFALAQGLGTTDSKLLIAVAAPCDGAFDRETRKLPGVAGTACASYSALNMADGIDLTTVQLGGGRKTAFADVPVGFGFFELFGVRPLAGRLFRRDHGEDGVAADPKTEAMPTVIINQAAARALGFSDPRSAVGRTLNWARDRRGVEHPSGPPPMAPSRIIGVVPDIPKTVRLATLPSLYFVDPGVSYFVNVRLTGQDVQGTVKAIANTWKRTSADQPLNALFLSQSRLTLYLDLIVQGTTIAICAGLAVLIACLGLFALSAYTTERRTKEIGVRKALGADTRQVVLLLLWQFTIPVLIATAIAVPIGFLAMGWWLRGFAYHVPMSAWTFVLAAVMAMGIAWVTVTYQSLIVARAKPVNALRYE